MRDGSQNVTERQQINFFLVYKNYLLINKVSFWRLCRKFYSVTWRCGPVPFCLAQ